MIVTIAEKSAQRSQRSYGNTTGSDRTDHDRWDRAMVYRRS